MRALVAFLVGLWALAAAAAAQAGETIAYSPAPAWVKTVAFTPAPASRGGPYQILLLDSQVRFAKGEAVFYYETAVKVLTAQGLSDLGTLSNSWDPAIQSLTVHKAEIVRDGQVIDLLADGEFTILRREQNLSQAMLDGQLTAVKEVKGLRVGDIVHMATSIRHVDSILGDKPEAWTTIGHPGVAARVRYRAIWPKSEPVRWNTTEGWGKVVRTETADEVEIQVDETNVETPRPPEGAPARFNTLAEMELTAYKDWEQVSSRLAPLYVKASTLAADSPLKAEAEKIKAAHATPQARTLAALQLVQREVRYLALLMGEGGQTPADADLTWQRRFGDCKGKTALLIALLNEFGVKAEPAAVHSRAGETVDMRLPRVGVFDHVLVRAEIDGQVYWLDGTRMGDRDLADLQELPLSWALPLRVSGGGIEKLRLTPASRPTLETLIDVDASTGFNTPGPGKVSLVIRGAAGRELAEMMASAPRDDLDKLIRENWFKDLPWLKIDKLDFGYDGEAGGMKITAEGSAEFDWGQRLSIQVPAMYRYEVIERPAGPYADAPYALPYPLFVKETTRLRLPRGRQGSVQGRDVELTAGGVAIRRASRVAGQDVVIEMEARTLVPEIGSREALAALRTFQNAATASAVTVLAVAPNAAAARIQARQEQITDLLDKARRPQPAAEQLNYLNQVLALDGENRQALELRANLHNQMGKPDLALRDVRALARGPFVSQSAPYLELEALLGMKDYRAMSSRADRLLRQDEKNPLALRYKAVAFAGLGQPGEMLTAFETVYALQGPAAADFLLPQLRKVVDGAPDAQYEALDKVLVAKPGSPAARVLRGYLQGLKDQRMALPQYDQALVLDENFQLARRLRFSANLALKQYDKALTDLDRLIQDTGDSSLLVRRGDLHLLLNHHEDALKDYDEAIRQTPANATLFNQRCWVRAIANLEPQKALGDCNEALRLRPTYAAAFDSRGLVNLRLKRHAEAIADYDSSLASREYAGSLYGRGLAKKHMGDGSGAEADLAKARQLDPEIGKTFEGYGLTP